jgi:wyosine [tRNA(Phe)-imidazoG37] synthetase (radical SAM superfamily)
VPTDAVIREIDRYCADDARVEDLDFITVTASGEPTLHSGFGRILQHLKATAVQPVAVLTNGTTMSDPVVRQELAIADVGVPSLDAALPESFRKLDRPATCLDLEEIIQGLVTFSREYRGRLWLEILFARGINDSNKDIEALVHAASLMRVDRIQLNTVARPPLESFARPLSAKRLQEIADRFIAASPERPVDLLARGACQDDDDVQRNSDPVRDADENALLAEIMEMLKRRPCTAADINRTFHLGGPDKVEQLLAPLVHSGRVQIRAYGDRLYYQ